METPRIARADLTAAALAKLHWQRHRDPSTPPAQTAHLLTVLGYDHDRGTISTVECRADRGDSERHCALFEACRHPTSDNDYEIHDHLDTMLCPDGGQHVMISDTDENPGWYKDTRRCRFAHYCDLSEPINDLNLGRGIYFVVVSFEDWAAGEVALEVIATVGEPVSAGVVSIAAQVVGDDRLWFGLESDIRDILCSELEDEIEHDIEDGTITVNVVPAVRELVRYLEGQPPTDPVSRQRPRPGGLADSPALESSRRRPIATINTGGLL